MVSPAREGQLVNGGVDTMCDQEGPISEHGERRELSRRKFLAYSASLAAIAAGFPEWPRTVFADRSPIAAADGTLPVSMAMHIHSSFSEQYGSMEGHLFQAQQNAVDVIWWTDHDYRMSSLGYRKTVHFTSLTAEKGGPGEGGAWQWQLVRTGPLSAHSSGGIVTSPASPLDPVIGGSLAVSAQSTKQSPATLGFYAQSHPSDWNYHCSLIGQTLSIEVLPTAIGATAYLEFLVTSSYHPARNGRPAGQYVLSYRFGGSGRPGTRSVSGLLGVVNVPVVPRQWNSIAVNPAADIAALWPDMDARDFGLFGLNLNAVSTGGAASGNFDYLRFSRSAGDVQLQAQQDMEVDYRSSYPGVEQFQALEISLALPHINWFGSGVALTEYGTVGAKQYQAFLQSTVIPQIHAVGGLVSYNHPYGVQAIAALPQASQNQKLTAVASAILKNRALAADILEVGYPLRSGVDLAHHIALWDVCSRNALFLTGNGVSDDHVGTDWCHFGNNWFTSVWAVSNAEADLLSALSAGRSWCASLSGYRGGLDLLVDGACPMGSASVSARTSRQLTVIATELPTKSTLQVVRGAVDYAGTAAPAPNTSIIASYGAAALSSGSVTLPVDCTVSSFVRAQVVNSSGTIVALSNPAWLLREVPPGGIPAPRAC
jgi:hypothetical protein